MRSGETGQGWTSPEVPNPVPAATAAPHPLAPESSPTGWHTPSQLAGQGYPQPGYPEPGYPQAGYLDSGYPQQPAYLPHGHPMPGYPWPQPPVPPPVKNSPLRWVVVVACLLVICTFGSVGAIVGISDLAGIDRRTVTWHAAELPVDVPPPVNAPASEWNTWARQAVDASVRNQAAALVAGDETRYLAPADSENQRLIADLQRRYRVVREMGVGQWTQTIRTTPKVIGERTWSADIKLSYCFGEVTCRANNLILATEWRFSDDRLWLTELEASESDQYGPRPWETSDLVIGAGSRVVVASAQRYSSRLTDTVAMADRAAKIADTLARWQPAPSRYVVFIAGPSDWSTWYSYEQPEWAGGVYVHQTDNEVVINGPYTSMEDMETLLTHEFTHVSTMAGKRAGVSSSVWWLIEGVADYAPMIGKPVSAYDPQSLSAIRSFVNGAWDGDPAVDGPSFNAPLEEASARYGMAFLTVRRIADVYGHDRMLDFWGKMVHDDASAETAATQALGASWSTVMADCAQYIRNIS